MQASQSVQGRKSDDISLTSSTIDTNHAITKQDGRQSNLFSNWRQKLSKSSAVVNGVANGHPSLPNFPGAFPRANNEVSGPPAATDSTPWNQVDGNGITPQENIKRNVRAAIEVCSSRDFESFRVESLFTRPADPKVMQLFAVRNTEPTLRKPWMRDIVM